MPYREKEGETKDPQTMNYPNLLNPDDRRGPGFFTTTTTTTRSHNPFPTKSPQNIYAT